MRLLLLVALGLFSFAGCDGEIGTSLKKRVEKPIGHADKNDDKSKELRGRNHNGVIFYAAGNPDLLSQWGVLKVEDDALILGDRVLPYDLNTPLFSDYAHKLRTVWLPAGYNATYRAQDIFEFPVGTIISKTFYYPLGADTRELQVQKKPDEAAAFLNKGGDLKGVRLIETRLLVRRAAGWAAFPYIWNEAQTDARLKRTGDIVPLELVSTDALPQRFNYIVPNVNQCAGCHATNATTRQIRPIGPRGRHLNKYYTYKEGRKNQLNAWQERGFLGYLPPIDDISENANWQDLKASVDARARAYLDINCAHCHNPVGPADTSGLHLGVTAPSGPSLGVCKLPIAAGRGTGGRAFDIVPGQPHQSIFIYRLASTNPAEMMPELGRTLSHEEGVELITSWIAMMQGECVPAGKQE